jgi:polyisoprenoid-binding protein YceI
MIVARATLPVRWITAAACCACALIARSLVAQAVPDRPLGHGMLAFDADATLGKFTGTTTTLTGQLTGAGLLAGVRGWVEAPSKSLTTNNGHRDGDMAGSLEIEKYPVIRFDLDSIAVAEKQGDSTTVTLAGSFTIHGQKHAAQVPGWIWLSAKSARFRGALPINVKDYGVGGLSKMLGMLKMNQMITVRIDVTFGEK